jgi:hypothetical protein
MSSEPKLKQAKNWSKDRRFAEAINKVEHEDWTQVRAAEWYGVSRQQLNLRLREFRKRNAEAEERAEHEAELAATITEQASSPLALSERRRIQDPITFHQDYFGHIPCPDCGTTHPMPDFHREIIGLCQDDGILRGGVNLPPYHAKTTVGSIRDTLYDICKDPNSRTLIVSKSQPFAQQILQAINEHLTNPEIYEGAARNLILDWGPFKSDSSSQVWNNKQIYVAGRTTAEKDPTVQVLGFGNQIYGRRADKLKFDDIADTENSRNPEQVARMMAWMDKDALSRIGQNGRALWFGTRVGAGDIYSIISKRNGYKWLRYPFILDDEDQLTLWPDHFSYTYAEVLREQMNAADWQLIYQNVDMPGAGAAFTQEIVDAAKDTSRVLGQWSPGWRLVAGVDLAGGSKGAGYTAFTLLGVDLNTGTRYLIDQYAEKSMKAPRIKDLILEWSERYPIFEWRVETNAVQSQVIQYNEEIIRPLALKGIRVQGHNTGKNKWDEQFGVETLSPLLANGLWKIPWASTQTRKEMQIFEEELLGFPMAPKSDRVMSAWFADLGCRDLLKRMHLPMFDDRSTRKWPARIRRRRKVVDFHNQQVQGVPVRDQRPGHAMSVSQAEFRRQMVGAPTKHGQFPVAEPVVERRFVNVDRPVP